MLLVYTHICAMCCTHACSHTACTHMQAQLMMSGATTTAEFVETVRSALISAMVYNKYTHVHTRVRVHTCAHVCMHVHANRCMPAWCMTLTQRWHGRCALGT